ncbi:ABC1 kinase family protein [Nocardia sp. NPDC058058]|uniref:ABC1 kinase family protein n=1 Tax=Nocardia sp. NPDC058058 TaxID=3346317 RepID=UPI0036D7B19B
MSSHNETRWSRKLGFTRAELPGARNMQLAALPAAFAGRHTAGVGKRLLGTPKQTVRDEIRERTAQHVFEVLGSLRGCAAKLGQILALYPGGVPEEIAGPYREALARLQYAAPPMLPAAVDAALTEYLGPDWRADFREFDDRHATAASIGQVHRAIWRDGTPVAVKIRYPGVTESIESDLRQLRRVAHLVAVLLPGMDIEALADEVCAGIRCELDYRCEADNQRAFAENYRDDPEFVIPRVIDQHAGVLITEWLEGEPLTTLLGRGEPSASRDRLGTAIIRFCVGSVQRVGLIYCDPHPGNFLVLANGRVGVVDFGACPPPPSGIDDLLAAMLDAGLSGDPAGLDAMLRRYEFLRGDGEFDAAEFLRVLEPFRRIAVDPTTTFTSTWLRARMSEGLNLRLTNVHRRLAMPPELSGYCRMLLTLVAVLAQLEATVAVGDIVADHLPEFAAIRTALHPMTVRDN